MMTWPCHSLPQDQWCDNEGPGGFMGHTCKIKGPVTQPWTHQLTFMQQSVLLACVRGPDNTEKYHPCKYLVRWYRRCILLSAMDGEIIDNPTDQRGGSFTGPSIDPWDETFGDANESIDAMVQAQSDEPSNRQLHSIARRAASIDRSADTRPYLQRNMDIVKASDWLFATPKGEEVTRSGTWSTVRLARNLGKPHTIIMPDGSIM